MFDFIDFRDKNKNGYHSNVIPCTIHPQNIQCVAKIDKHNEHAIYHFMQSIPLGSIAPKYYGLWECHDYAGFPKKDRDKRMQADSNFNYIIMEDLMHGFKSPNFVDIKLGTRTSDVRTKKRSIDRLAFLVASTTSADFGFRITDIINNKNKKEGSKKTKRREMAHNIFETNNFFKTFFSNHQLKSIYDELKHIRNVIILTLHQFPGFRIYASSVFMTYDSEAPEDSEVRVKLIDFAHVHFDVDKDGGDRNSLQYDDGVLRGLDSLVLLIGLILCERKIPLGNENLVDPEEEKEKEQKKLMKAKKESTKGKEGKGKGKDTKKSKDKDSKKSKDIKTEKSKEKDKQIPKESPENKEKDEHHSDLKTSTSKIKNEIDDHQKAQPHNSINTEIIPKENEKEIEEIMSEKSKETENVKLDKENDKNQVSVTQDEDTERDDEINEEEEEEAESEKDDDEPIDSESFNDRQPDSESEDKHEENN